MARTLRTVTYSRARDKSRSWVIGAYDALSYDSMLAFGGQLRCVSFTYKVDLPNRTWSIFDSHFTLCP